MKLAASNWWLVGSGALLVGYVVQAIALDHGRLAIIQPLLVTTVVFALPLGYFFTSQSVGSREIVGAAIVVAGLAMYAIFGDRRAATRTRRTTSGSLRCSSSPRCASCCSASRITRRRAPRRVLCVASGVLFGVSACLVKPTLEALDTGGVSEALST